MSSPLPNMGVNFGPVQGRKRALTKTLLGSQYEETVTSILDPPMPLQDLSEYTAERVRESLRYADTTLRHPERKISPAGGIALQLYKDTCIGLLDMLDVEEGEIFETTAEERKAVEDSHRVFIREAEKGIQINACMQLTRTKSAHELQEEIFKLQRFAFYARYGDYFAGVCNELKITAEKGKLAGWQTLSKAYWSDIAKNVEIERPIYEKFLKGEKGLHAQMQTTHAIQVTCLSLGMHPEDTLQIVEQYGIRNDLLHANLLPLIKKGLFATLAKRLCLDRIDIPLLTPAADKADGKILEVLLDSIIDMWFQKDESDPANYEMWTATSELRHKRNELNGGSSPGKSEALINQYIAKDITKAFKQNLKKSSKEEELIELFKSTLATKGHQSE